MQRIQEKVWVTVSAEVLASIEAVRLDIEKATRIKPSMTQTVLMLIKRGLKCRLECHT